MAFTMEFTGSICCAHFSSLSSIVSSGMVLFDLQRKFIPAGLARVHGMNLFDNVGLHVEGCGVKYVKAMSSEQR